MLTREEQSVLNGSQGPVMAKVMRTVTDYASILGAERLVDIEGDGHFSIGDIIPGLGPRMEMLEELVDAGVKTKYPFTIDPLGPVDYQNFALTSEQEPFFLELKDRTERHMAIYAKLGLKPTHNFTCTPYFPEVGNIPAKGTILAWSESSCVIYVNSVLGARTNRNAVTFDLLSNIAGKTPYYGLLTDEGRRATWLINIETSVLPDPQLLGGVIGRSVVADVPYIKGLDYFLGTGIDNTARDYLKEFGAACAAIGAVGLYHVHGITPEAAEQGETLLVTNRKQLSITDQLLEQARQEFPNMWKHPSDKAKKVLIGCPHLSLGELYMWKDDIKAALQRANRSTVAIPTILCAAPSVLDIVRADVAANLELEDMGIRVSPACIEGYMNNELCAAENIATNSNKLRDISTAKFYPGSTILDVIAGIDA